MKVFREEVLRFVPALTNKYAVTFQNIIEIGLQYPQLFDNSETTAISDKDSDFKSGTTTWFPAISVDNGFANVRTKTSDILFAIETPEGSDPLTASITFVDNSRLSLKKFFRKWMQEIVIQRETYTVGLLKDICAEMFIHKFADGIDEYTDTDGYLVYPKGELSENLQSGSGAPYTLQVAFAIAGIVKHV